jgi:hypothetical protein
MTNSRCKRERKVSQPAVPTWDSPPIRMILCFLKYFQGQGQWVSD